MAPGFWFLGSESETVFGFRFRNQKRSRLLPNRSLSLGISHGAQKARPFLDSDSETKKWLRFLGPRSQKPGPCVVAMVQLLCCSSASWRAATLQTSGRDLRVSVPNEVGSETSSQRGEGSFLLSSHTRGHCRRSRGPASPMWPSFAIGLASNHRCHK